MAYVALLSLARTIDLILDHHQDSISSQVKNQIISIYEYVIFLQAFLEEFPDKANRFEAIIRKVTHVVEDIIELFMSKHVYEPRYASSESSVGQLKSQFGHKPKEHYGHLRYSFHELKEATQEIESIAEIMMKFKNRITVKDGRIGDSTAVISSSRVAPVHKDAMVGFDNDVLQIKSRLCGESSKREVIPVFGMGGIGKTTLARNVYDDPLIMEHFDIRVWVTVSQDYSVQGIVSCLLISMKISEDKDKLMRDLVYQNLKFRRYLIVLDDIWSIEAWDDLKMMFPDDGNGSRIILTTRLSEVASYADSFSPVHQMHLMDEDQSWNLLRQKVFKRDPSPDKLENIGKTIARSCRGLPLAIVVISGIMSSADQTEAAWENIARNVKSAISTNDEQLDKILSLSYTHLPLHLRPCFLYMGGFPEDCEMHVSRLTGLWVAEGFLKPKACNKSFEETAEEYLEDLVKRSLVLVTKRASNGRIKRCRMHDLMREMCIRKAQEENFFLRRPVFLRKGMDIPRRVSIIRSDLGFHENVDGLTIRTILYSGHLSGRLERFHVQYFRLLRVLDLLDDRNCSLPAGVFELFHLRYLAFNWRPSVSAAISNLRNLQTLILFSYYSPLSYSANDFIPFLPEIWSMPQLRHLDIRHGFCFCLPPLKAGATTFCLANLNRLSLAINFVCTPEILKLIPNLKKLGISYREHGYHAEDYQLHNLIYLQQLENLKLEVHYNCHYWEKKVNIIFPRTLKKLTLRGLRLPWENMKIVGSLPNLEVLKLRNHSCDGNTWETTEGEFSQLKFLLIDGSDLQHWITESSHFPRLQCLVLHFCQYLSEIPDDIGEIPTLELIEVDDCNKSLLDSAKQMQDDQQSCGNDALQLRLVKRS